jgi:hypothetical protein
MIGSCMVVLFLLVSGSPLLYNFSNGSYLKMPFSIGLITQILQQDDSDQKFIS